MKKIVALACLAVGLCFASVGFAGNNGLLAKMFLTGSAAKSCTDQYDNYKEDSSTLPAFCSCMTEQMHGPKIVTYVRNHLKGMIDYYGSLDAAVKHFCDKNARGPRHEGCMHQLGPFYSNCKDLGIT